MPDYSLGRAHGEIVIDFDGSGADKAAAGLDKVAASSAAADASLDKTHKSLGDTGKAMDSAGSSADGYRQRLNDVEHASRDVESAEKNLRGTLLNSKATLDDVKAAEDRVTESKKRHTSATNAARDAHKAFSAELSLGERAVSALASIFPKLTSSIDDVATGSDNASSKASGLAGKLSDVAKVVGLLGPEGKAAAGGLLLLSKGMDSVGGSASSSAGFVSSLVQQIASFEVGFGKIAGLSLGAVSLGGLAGLGGAAGVQGIVELAGAAEQLSGVLGLLPSIMAGVGFSAGTLDVAFRNVGAALKDMMSDDPKKFLEDIKDMAPAAAQALLQVAGFRDQIKLGGAAVQESFFSQIAADIAPLIQTWLPAIVSGMSQVSGIFGEAAHKFAGLLQQPGAMNAFTQFIANLSAGLKALEPAMVPLFNIFSQLTVVGFVVLRAARRPDQPHLGLLLAADQQGGLVGPVAGLDQRWHQRVRPSGQHRVLVRVGVPEHHGHRRQVRRRRPFGLARAVDGAAQQLDVERRRAEDAHRLLHDVADGDGRVHADAEAAGGGDRVDRDGVRAVGGRVGAGMVDVLQHVRADDGVVGPADRRDGPCGQHVPDRSVVVVRAAGRDVGPAVAAHLPGPRERVRRAATSDPGSSPWFSCSSSSRSARSCRSSSARSPT
jgi:hypothetical protein